MCNLTSRILITFILIRLLKYYAFYIIFICFLEIKKSLYFKSIIIFIEIIIIHYMILPKKKKT